MLRNLRERAQNEKGFTLIELLVVILIIGILAAIAIPSFLNQRTKATDSEAKSGAVTAAEAMETCATDNNGNYSTASCTTSDLKTIEPTLNDLGARITATPNTNSYEIVVTANRDSNGVTYTLSRASAGTTTRTCAVGGNSKGGCPNGTW